MSASRDRQGFAPGMVLRVFGMRRSGNHAIAAWLLRNAPDGRSVYLNNCRAGRNPLDSFRSVEINGQPVPVKPALEDLSSVADVAGDGSLLLISYEDTLPSESRKGRPVSGDFDENRIDADLIIYRGFVNWIASLVKKLQANPEFSLTRRSAVALRAIDTYAHLLALIEAREQLRLTCICYDQWVQNEEYRRGVLRDLGLQANDTALGPVRREGGGSSFQANTRNADDLAPARRWAQMADDPEYQAILQLAARDENLTDRLSRLFPEDAARLAAIRKTRAIPDGGLI